MGYFPGRLINCPGPRRHPPRLPPIGLQHKLGTPRRSSSFYLHNRPDQLCSSPRPIGSQRRGRCNQPCNHPQHRNCRRLRHGHDVDRILGKFRHPFPDQGRMKCQCHLSCLCLWMRYDRTRITAGNRPVRCLSHNMAPTPRFRLPEIGVPSAHALYFCDGTYMRTIS